MIPSHKDTPAQHIESLPQLGYMTELQRRQLVDKFLAVPTDELSFNQYFVSLFS